MEIKRRTLPCVCALAIAAAGGAVGTRGDTTGWLEVALGVLDLVNDGVMEVVSAKLIHYEWSREYIYGGVTTRRTHIVHVNPDGTTVVFTTTDSNQLFGQSTSSTTTSHDVFAYGPGAGSVVPFEIREYECIFSDSQPPPQGAKERIDSKITYLATHSYISTPPSPLPPVLTGYFKVHGAERQKKKCDPVTPVLPVQICQVAFIPNGQKPFTPRFAERNIRWTMDTGQSLSATSN